jgi:hypothetical protein
MTEVRMPPSRTLPELEEEQDVDLGKAWSTVVERWWLPALGIVAGIVLGYLLALGGTQVYQAKTTLYLGQPFSPTGNAPVQSLNTNPRTVSAIARSESAIKAAAAASGLRPGRLRGRISSSAVSAAAAGSGAARGTQGQLVDISVKGRAPRKVERAADALAAIVIARVSGYVNTKIRTYNRRLNGGKEALASNQRRIALLTSVLQRERGIAPLEQLVLVSQLDNAEQRRGVLLEEESDTEQLLSLAQNVERARVIAKASAVKTTARSKRNSMLVGALIGLILGIVAALAWEPVATRLGRRAPL